MLLEKWAEELRCRLLHRAAGAKTVRVDGKDICFVWCGECDTVLASRLHDVGMREDLVSDSLPESCEQIACRLAQSLPMTQANLVRVIGVRAELAEIERRSAERKVARWQSAAFAMLLLSIVLWLSGCDGTIGEPCRANGTCIGDKLECRFQYNSIDGRPIYRCMLKDDQKCVAPK
jgi:hypothetical protein